MAKPRRSRGRLVSVGAARYGVFVRYGSLAADPDAVSNLQWQTIRDARAKDRWERQVCAR